MTENAYMLFYTNIVSEVSHSKDDIDGMIDLFYLRVDSLVPEKEAIILKISDAQIQIKN